MASPIADKIKNTQSSFPDQKTGAVTECPFRSQKPAKKPDMPIDTKTAYQLTQDVATPNEAKFDTSPAEKPKEKKHWIEIILVDAEGEPMPGVKYRITPPGGGAPKEGRLNEHGQAGYYKIEAGECKVTFPDLDQDAWE
jgi:hypothetical protein